MTTSQTFPADDLKEWFTLMFTPSVLIEVVVLLVCCGMAWGMTVLVRGKTHQAAEKSVLFGRRVFDGVLFPLLWLCFTFAALIMMRSGLYYGSVAFCLW